jgi:hypothetical protein
LEQLRRDWKAPAELTLSTPREVKLTGSGIFLAIMSALMFLGAIAAQVFLSRQAASQAEQTRELRAGGVVVKATVTRHWRTSGKDSERRIAYEFQYEGSIYRSSVKAPKSIWARLDVGSPIDVRFLPGRPERNHPADWEKSDMPFWLPPALAVLLVALGVLFAFVVRRQIRLLSEGRAAPAMVIGYRNSQHGQKALKYEFPLVEGGVGKGSGHPTRKPVAVGSTITVIYDRDNPKRNSPYPMEMVRVVR